MGLETAHPDALARLNKRMTLDVVPTRGGVPRAARHRAPRVRPAEARRSCRHDEARWHGRCRSIDLALRVRRVGVLRDSDARRQRRDGGAAATGDRAPAPPRISSERRGVRRRALGRRRVFADLWDIERFFDCACSPHARRLRQIEREQRRPTPVLCAMRPRELARDVRISTSRSSAPASAAPCWR